MVTSLGFLERSDYASKKNKANSSFCLEIRSSIWKSLNPLPSLNAFPLYPSYIPHLPVCVLQERVGHLVGSRGIT